MAAIALAEVGEGVGYTLEHALLSVWIASYLAPGRRSAHPNPTRPVPPKSQPREWVEINSALVQPTAWVGENENPIPV